MTVLATVGVGIVAFHVNAVVVVIIVALVNAIVVNVLHSHTRGSRGLKCVAKYDGKVAWLPRIKIGPVTQAKMRLK